MIDLPVCGGCWMPRILHTLVRHEDGEAMLYSARATVQSLAAGRTIDPADDDVRLFGPREDFDGVHTTCAFCNARNPEIVGTRQVHSFDPRELGHDWYDDVSYERDYGPVDDEGFSRYYARVSRDWGGPSEPGAIVPWMVPGFSLADRIRAVRLAWGVVRGGGSGAMIREVVGREVPSYGLLDSRLLYHALLGLDRAKWYRRGSDQLPEREFGQEPIDSLDPDDLRSWFAGWLAANPDLSFAALLPAWRDRFGHDLTVAQFNSFVLDHIIPLLDEWL